MEKLLVCPWIECQQNHHTRLLFLNGSRRVFFLKFCQGKNHEIGKTLQNTSVVTSRRANESLRSCQKNALYLNVKVFTSTKVLIDDTIFTSPTGEGTAILRGHPSHVNVSPLAVQR